MRSKRHHVHHNQSQNELLEGEFAQWLISHLLLLSTDQRTSVYSGNWERPLGPSLHCVGRNPIETAAFVDERKSLSIIGSFYLWGGFAQRVTGTDRLHL